MSQTSNNLASYIWAIADLLRGDFKQSQYGRIILPFTLLRRLECVLAPSKDNVLTENERIQSINFPEDAKEKLLLRATNGLTFFNHSKMDLSKLGESDIKANLDSYLQGFSKDAREIFEYFNFSEFVGQLNDANLLYKVIQKVRKTDLSPQAISNHEMGLVFEELIRRFAESSNETAGEHFTPRDIVRLTTAFYNTGIATYIWILPNKKSDARKGKVQLINGVNLCGKMRKSLGSKRNEMSEDDSATIIKTFGAFEVVDARVLDKPAEQKSNRGRQSSNPKSVAAKTFASKIFNTHHFGYRRITIERPLRESYQFSDQRIASLRYANKPLNAVMQWVYEDVGQQWQDNDDANYGDLSQHSETIRSHIKTHFSGLKEAKIKELFNAKLWQTQLTLLNKAKQLQGIIGTEQHDTMNDYDNVLKAACQQAAIKLDAKEKKAITSTVSWKNPEAEKVIKKMHKNTAANPLYGLFHVDCKTVEYKADGDLRDHENVALDPSQRVNALNEAYFIKEVQPHVADAWIDANKQDAKDGEIGIVGYEIPFNQQFRASKNTLSTQRVTTH